MNIKKCYSLIFTTILLLSSSLYSQDKIEDFFDNAVGKDNLPLSNGKLFSNDYKTTEINQFFFPIYSIENITYKNQTYSNVTLKYDLYRDIVIYRPYGKSENFGIELIPEDVNSFTINNNKFIKLSGIYKGYYEEKIIGNKINLYIKHKKEIRDFVKDKLVYYNFILKNEYVIEYENNLYTIKTKKDLIEIFKENKNEITAFFKKNSNLFNENKTLFFEKIIQQLENNIK